MFALYINESLLVVLNVDKVRSASCKLFDSLQLNICLVLIIFNIDKTVTGFSVKMVHNFICHQFLHTHHL